MVHPLRRELSSAAFNTAEKKKTSFKLKTLASTREQISIQQHD